MKRNATFAAGTALTFVSSNLATGLTVRALAGLGAGMAIPVVFGEIISRSPQGVRHRAARARAGGLDRGQRQIGRAHV